MGTHINYPTQPGFAQVEMFGDWDALWGTIIILWKQTTYK